MDYELILEAELPTNTTMKVIAVYKRNKKKYYDVICSSCDKTIKVRADAVTANGYKQQKECRKCSYITRDGINLKGYTTKYKHLYYVYSNMLDRCYNENSKAYKNYGAKGVTVCSKWKDSFIAFADWALSQGFTYDELCTKELDKDYKSKDSKQYSPDTCLFVSRHFNNIIKPKTSKVTSSKYIGVNWGKSTNRWEWGLRLPNGTRKRGYGKTEEEAAYKREQYIIDNNLSHTRNFNE